MKFATGSPILCCVSQLCGVSQARVISGYSELTGNTATHALIWNSYTSPPTDLDTHPGGTNRYPRAVKRVGQVVGYADVP